MVEHENYSWTTVSLISSEFLVLGTCSAFIGFVFGLGSGLVTKHCRFVTRNATHETFLLLIFAAFSYFTADLLKMSGIISIIVTAVMQAQYAWYNLSPQGQHVTAVTFQSLAYFSEALIFCYIGLGFFSYSKFDWSPSFIAIELVIVMVGRFASVILVQYVFVLFGAQQTLKLKELLFISLAGMIRGAIALGLAVKSSPYFKEFEIVCSTVLALVIISTLVFGSFMPIFAKLLLQSKQNPKNLKSKNNMKGIGDENMESLLSLSEKGQA